MTQLRRTVPPELIALFNSTMQVQVADLYSITLADDSVLRWSGSDTRITLGATSWELGPGLRRDFLEFRMGVDTAQSVFFITATADDEINGQPLLPFILRGGLDGAGVVIHQAYAGPDGVWVGALERFTGSVADVETAGRGEVSITVASLTELLSRPLPPGVFQPQCKNSLYDASCGLLRSSYVATGTATGPATGGRLVIPHALPQAAGWFDLGAILFTSGANDGVRRTVRKHTSSELTLMQPLPAQVVAGDAFTLWPGCNLTRAMCIDKFNNRGRFRGEPFTPPPETVT